jgi:hypothetical protein
MKIILEQKDNNCPKNVHIFVVRVKEEPYSERFGVGLFPVNSTFIQAVV